MGHLLRLDHVFGDDRRCRLVSLLSIEDPAWARSDVLGHTGHGPGTRQLPPASGRYHSPQMTTLRSVMASVCYSATKGLFDLPLPGHLDTQVFGVHMTGTPVDPPRQGPHVDNRDGVPPLVTAVYYADVQDVDGGQIAVGRGVLRHLLTLMTDTLIAFPGDTTHEVLAVRAGHRLSVVCNFYALT